MTCDIRSESDIFQHWKRQGSSRIFTFISKTFQDFDLCRNRIVTMHLLRLRGVCTPPICPSQRREKQHPQNMKDTVMAAFDTSRTTYGSQSLFGRLSTTLASFFGTVAGWNDARVTRNALSGLSDRELEDIGLVRGDIDLVASGKRSF
jgi:uncharacterized protein YjiS (DUF1127 family)